MERKRGSTKRRTGRKRKRSASGSARQRPVFPVAQLHNILIGDGPIEKVDATAPLYLAAIHQYVTQEVLEQAANHAITRKSNEITSEDIIAVIRDNEELNSIFDQKIIENEINRINEANERRRLISASKGRKVRPKFPVAEIHTMLAGDKPIEDIDAKVPVYLSAIEEYVAHELLENIGNHALSRGSNEITCEDIISVIQADDELNNLFGEVIDNEINAAREEV